MAELRDIIGKYNVVEAGTQKFSTEFTLEIWEDKEKVRFNLEMVINGEFGKIGRNWIGICIDRSDHFAMIIEKEIDWTYTTADNEKAENHIDIFEILPLELYPNEEQVIIYHSKLDRHITLDHITS